MTRAGRSGAALAVLAALTAAAPPASAKAPAYVTDKQELTALFTSHKVVSAPHHRPSRITRVAAVRPITGGQTVLPVLGHTTTRDGVHWLRVSVPGRPNGRSGWITRRGTDRRSTPWHVVVNTTRRRVSIYRDGRFARSFSAIVGAPSTPTPLGRFFVEESVIMPAGKPGGPFALALSGRSNVLQEFEGGPGQIALHGVANLGGTFGTAASHGCVRLANSHITWMAARIGPGVPVTIRR